jgi:hypothetical protein
LGPEAGLFFHDWRGWKIGKARDSEICRAPMCFTRGTWSSGQMDTVSSECTRCFAGTPFVMNSWSHLEFFSDVLL